MAMSSTAQVVLSACLLALLPGSAATASASFAPTIHHWRSTVRTAANLSTADARDRLLSERGVDCGVGELSATLEIYATEQEVGHIVRNDSAWLSAPILVERASQPPAGYRDWDNITALMRQWEQQFPAIAKVIDITEEFSGGRKTAEGNPIYAMKISDNVDVLEDEPNVLMTGDLHAQELQTPEAILALIEVALARKGEMREIVDNAQLWFIPVINTDGYKYCFEVEPFWRKNRFPNADGSFGVDLNRNFPQGWSSPCSGSTNPSSNTYKGTAPASEAETVALISMASSLNIQKLMDFHSTGRELLHGYGCTSMPALLDEYMEQEAGRLATFANYDLRGPSAEGEWYTNAIAYQTSYSFLTEMGALHQPTYADALIEVARILPVMAEFLATPVSVTGVVLDPAGLGEPVPALVERLDWEGQFMDNERRQADTRFGRYHLWLPDGAHNVRFSAPGYQPETRVVQVVAGQTVRLDVELTLA